MATTLLGYVAQQGPPVVPHSITTNDDYDVACVRVDNISALLTIGLEIAGGYDGNITVKSRRRGSNDSFVNQSYVKPDGSLGTTTINASTVIQIDATGKEIRLTTAARTVGTATAGFDVTTQR